MSNGKMSTTLDYTNFEALLSDFDRALRSLVEFREKISKSLPAKYGSEEWWKRSTAKSLDDYKKGKYMSFSSAKDLIKELNS